MDLRVVPGQVPVDHDRLGRTLLADEQHGLLLLGDAVDEEVCPHVVHVGYEDRPVLRGVVRRVRVLLNTCVPVLPLACAGGDRKHRVRLGFCGWDMDVYFVFLLIFFLLYQLFHNTCAFQIVFR